VTSVAVVGHVEWIEMVRVDHVPRAGEIVHGRERLEFPGGGGAVVAVQLARLAGGCVLFTALGDDDAGRRAFHELSVLGVRVEATFRPEPQRRGFVHVDDVHERTITVIGDRMGPFADDPLPWGELDGMDGVYFTAGDDGALRMARRAGILVATSRVFDQLVRTGVALDALVGSARDRGEAYVPGMIRPEPRLVVRTEGERGGIATAAGSPRWRYEAAPVPGPRVDAYGCGDSFAAGLTFGLASGMPDTGAIGLAARCGAACLTGFGPFEGELPAAG
jgi:ribokinase